MATGQIEVSGAPNTGLTGTIEAEIYEQGGVQPTTIIGINQDWRVDFKWSLTGPLAPLICGKWCLHVRLESIGPGHEYALPLTCNEVTVPLDPCGDGHYAYPFTVSKGTVKAEDCSVPYKVVATVTYLNACDRPGPIAGFVEGPIIQFYDPGP
jgi:hypothetical protein